MAMTEVKVNEYNFSEIKISDTQPIFTNGTTRKILNKELVMDATLKYFGEVENFDGIEASASARIDIKGNRVIRTEQMTAADTFVVGDIVYFTPQTNGGAGSIVDESSSTTGDLAIGICEGFGGDAGSHTYIDVRVFDWSIDRALES